MQFIVNLFGTVIANKDVATRGNTTGLSILDEKVRVLSNHVDFLLQSHFSQQTVTLKTCDMYTSEDVRREDCEGGEHSPATATGEEEDDGRDEAEVHADVPAGDSQEERVGAGAGEAGTGSGEAPAAQARANAQNSD